MNHFGPLAGLWPWWWWTVGASANFVGTMDVDGVEGGSVVVGPSVQVRPESGGGSSNTIASAIGDYAVAFVGHSFLITGGHPSSGMHSRQHRSQREPRPPAASRLQHRDQNGEVFTFQFSGAHTERPSPRSPRPRPDRSASRTIT